MKHRIVHTLQKYVLNPPIKLALAVGLPLPGYALLETKGRKTGKPRRTPVGDGRIGSQFWLVAEHGMKAGYVRNIECDPRVRLKLREGFRTRWHTGTAHLLPDDVDQQARALELTDYAVATIHMQGFGRQFRASNFPPSAADEETVKARGKEIATKGFALLNKALEGKDYAVGTFSIADPAIFYTEFWSKRVGLSLPANCAAHLDRMLARPSVQRVMQQEGLA